jgi:hypothetical protein
VVSLKQRKEKYKRKGIEIYLSKGIEIYLSILFA